jgi:pimeloyl-ACP methyl ester carboxylesterase
MSDIFSRFGNAGDLPLPDLFGNAGDLPLPDLFGDAGNLPLPDLLSRLGNPENLPVVRPGEQSELVRAAQLLLQGQGFPLAADGIFGPATQVALESFQTANGLSADGILGPNTWAALVGKDILGNAPISTTKVGVVPVVFIPGVMGSRLRFTNFAKTESRVWDPDDEVTMGKNWVLTFSNTQREIFKHWGADVLGEAITQSTDGWPSVSQTYYGAILTQLRDGLKDLAPLDCPVYAVGYDWRQSNKDSGAAIANTVRAILQKHNAPKAILVTHSMGGLVARAACKFTFGFVDQVAGIVHIAQPVTGATIAYRRFFTGANDGKSLLGDHTRANFKANAMDTILGDEWWKWLAYMSVLPGPLQLLPNNHYTMPAGPYSNPGFDTALLGPIAASWTPNRWLYHYSKPADLSPFQLLPLPSTNIYDVYQGAGFPGICFGWESSIASGLTNGFSEAKWNNTVLHDLKNNLKDAAAFHAELGLYEHPNTMYMASMETTSTDVGFVGVASGSNGAFLKGPITSRGDGTVPLSSAQALFAQENDTHDANPDAGNPASAPPKPPSRLTSGGEHATIFDKADVREFVVKNAKYLAQR